METKVDPRQVRDFGEIINDSFLFAQQNWKTLLKGFVSVCGFFVLAGFVSQVFYQMWLMDAIKAGEIDLEQPLDSSSMFSVQYFVYLFFSSSSFLIVPLYTFSFVALYKINGDIAPDLADLWDYIKYYILRFFGSAVVLGALLFVGFVMCFVPGIYLWPIVSLVFAIMVIENGSLSYSFPRAFQLIRGFWWPTFGVLFILVFVVLTATLILMLPLLATGLTSFSLSSEQSTIGLVLAALISNLASVFGILPAIGLVFCYYSIIGLKGWPDPSQAEGGAETVNDPMD